MSKCMLQKPMKPLHISTQCSKPLSAKYPQLMLTCRNRNQHLYLLQMPLPALKILKGSPSALKAWLKHVLMMDAPYISSLQCITQHNSWRKKHPTIKYQSSILYCHPHSQQEEILFKSSYSSREKRQKLSLYNQQCQFIDLQLWLLLISCQKPCGFCIMFAFSVGSSRLQVILWTKEKAGKVFRCLFVFFREEIMTYVWERAKQFC